jgi:hypothetical protein
MEGTHSGLARMSVIPFIFVIIIGGIYSGIYTPTEAADAPRRSCSTPRLLHGGSRGKGVGLGDAIGPAHGHGLTIIAGGILFARFLVLTDACPR